MPFDLKEFGRRLRASRQVCELTQDELARRIDANRSWISELEHGHQDSLRAETVVRFAEALGVSADYLLGIKGAPAPPLPPAKRGRPHREAAGEERRHV